MTKGGVVCATGLPVLFLATVYCLLIAQLRAARPKPKPGSERTVADFARPDVSTRTTMVTRAKFTCSTLDSGGKGQFHPPPTTGLAGLERSSAGSRLTGAAGPLPAAAGTPPERAFRLRTALVAVPSAV